MDQHSALSPINVFISYRRDDARWPAGALYRKLVEQFGSEHVFYDIDSIPPGVDWRAHIEGMLAKVDVALILIGSRWLEAADERGRRRLDDPADTLRFELEVILARGIHAIPVLLDATAVPAPKDLPDPIRALPARNAIRLRSEPDFLTDVKRIVEFLARYDPVAYMTPTVPSTDPRVPHEAASLPEVSSIPEATRHVIRRPQLAPPPTRRLNPSLQGDYPPPDSPGWHPDPTGKYARRLWLDQWTFLVRETPWSKPITDPAEAEALAEPLGAGWWSDPVKVHRMRYFDGIDWTNRVADDGMEFIEDV
jgi:hypothetical protein